MAIRREAELMPDARRKSTRSEAQILLAALDHYTGLFRFLQILTSILIRAFVFIFLRWIPTALIFRVINPIFGTYVVTWSLRQLKVSGIANRLAEISQTALGQADLQELAENVDVDNSQRADAANLGEDGEYKAIEHKADGLSANGTAGKEEEEISVSPLSAGEMLKAAILGNSTRSSSFNWLSFALHSLLFLFYLDSAWSPYLFPSLHEQNLHFSRVGAVGPKSATIHVRYPHPLGRVEDWAGALIEEDFEGGSSGGALKNMQDLLDDPQPLRVIYRELRGLTRLRADSSSHESDLGNSIDGRIRTAAKRWERGPLLTLTAESDWTASAEIEGLWPATEYEWRLAFAHNSTFTPSPANPRKFITWPDPRLSEDKLSISILHAGLGQADDAQTIPYDDPNHFAFATSSCVKPDFPWLPTQFWAWSWALRLLGLGNGLGGWALRNRIPGFDKLAEAVLDGRDQPAIRFFLQLGDLIYADVPYYAGPQLNTYRKLYRNLFASQSFRRVYEQLPVIGIYDDHEVINNWGGNQLVPTRAEDGAVTKVREPAALRPATEAWQEYVGKGNPKSIESAENYYSFRYGDTAFFIMDTRKHRSPYQIPDDEHKTMLGHLQRDALVRWLGAVNSTATFKFVVSSVPFTTLWGGPLDWDGKQDSWAAYTTEREYLLEIMQYVPNIIVLSGDRHEFSSVGLAPQGTRQGYHPITEFSTSPLSMFYLPVRTLSPDHGLGPTGAERLYKYLPDGNHKWTELEVDTRDSENPVVRVKVLVDGNPAWRVTVHGTPVYRSRNAVGGLAKTFLELLSWRPRRWF